MTEAQLLALFRAETEDIVQAVLLQYYFNGGTPNYTPYANTEEALSVIGDNWKPYMPVNVAGVDYWFLPDGSLVNKVEYLAIADNSIALTKIVNMATASFIGRNTAETGPPEVLSVETVLLMLGLKDYATTISGINSAIGNKVDKVPGSSLITAELLAMIHEPGSDDQNLTAINEAIAALQLLASADYEIVLPSADTVAGRLVGIVEETNFPIGWILTASGGDLVIEHGLNRKVKEVVIWSKNDLESIYRKEIGNAAYSGLYLPIGETFDSFVIESLATIAAEITIYITFK